MDKGAQQADGLSSQATEPKVSAVPASIPSAIAHLEKHVLGLEIAVDCEQRIVAAYSDIEAEWEARQARITALPLNERYLQPEAPMLNGKMRNMLDARANARRIGKDAAAIRVLLEFAASAIEAGTAETGTGSVHESAAPQEDAHA